MSMEAPDMDLRQKVRNFIIAYTRLREFADDDRIFAQGGVNSMFAMELLMFVERECGCTVPDDDLNLGNFQSIATIARLMSRLSVPQNL